MRTPPKKRTAYFSNFKICLISFKCFSISRIVASIDFMRFCFLVVPDSHFSQPLIKGKLLASFGLMVLAAQCPQLIVQKVVLPHIP